MDENKKESGDNKDTADHIEEMLEELDMSDSGGDTDEKGCCKSNQEEITKLRDENRVLKDKLLREMAEAESYKKRLAKDMEDKVKFANQSLVSSFLTVLDNFDLALQHADEDAETILEGIKLNQKVMLDSMSKAGVKLIKVEIGDSFDPSLHEAISITNNSDMPDNTISIVIQNGYCILERVIRPVKVQVNKLS